MCNHEKRSDFFLNNRKKEKLYYSNMYLFYDCICSIIKNIKLIFLFFFLKSMC